MGNADGEGQEKDDSLVHESVEANESLVKANGRLPSPKDARVGHGRRFSQQGLQLLILTPTFN